MLFNQYDIVNILTMEIRSTGGEYRTNYYKNISL